jgi:ABC-type polysaccharide/polyol phosphate export permease
VWAGRGLLYEFALRDVRVRYRQAALGVLWALLIPGLTVLAGLVLRYVALRGSGESVRGAHAIVGTAVKAVAWTFFSQGTVLATTSLAASAGLVGRVYFPREVLPLSALLAQCVDLLAGVATAVVLLALTRVDVGPAILWAPPLLALLLVLTAGLSVVLACANLFFRDVKYLVQVLLTFGLFFTPVFFDAGQFGGRGARLLMLNPVAPILEGLRLSVVQRHNLLHRLVLADGGVAWEPWLLAYSGAWAVGCVAAGALLYDRLEPTFAEYV